MNGVGRMSLVGRDIEPEGKASDLDLAMRELGLTHGALPMKKTAKKVEKIRQPTAQQWGQFNEVMDRFLQAPQQHKTAKKKRKKK